MPATVRFGKQRARASGVYSRPSPTSRSRDGTTDRRIDRRSRTADTSLARALELADVVRPRQGRVQRRALSEPRAARPALEEAARLDQGERGALRRGDLERLLRTLVPRDAARR